MVGPAQNLQLLSDNIIQHKFGIAHIGHSNSLCEYCVAFTDTPRIMRVPVSDTCRVRQRHK